MLGFSLPIVMLTLTDTVVPSVSAMIPYFQEAKNTELSLMIMRTSSALKGEQKITLKMQDCVRIGYMHRIFGKWVYGEKGNYHYTKPFHENK